MNTLLPTPVRYFVRLLLLACGSIFLLNNNLYAQEDTKLEIKGFTPNVQDINDTLKLFGQNLGSVDSVSSDSSVISLRLLQQKRYNDTLILIVQIPPDSPFDKEETTLTLFSGDSTIPFVISPPSSLQVQEDSLPDIVAKERSPLYQLDYSGVEYLRYDYISEDSIIQDVDSFSSQLSYTVDSLFKEGEAVGNITLLLHFDPKRKVKNKISLMGESMSIHYTLVDKKGNRIPKSPTKVDAISEYELYEGVRLSLAKKRLQEFAYDAGYELSIDIVLIEDVQPSGKVEVRYQTGPPSYVTFIEEKIADDGILKDVAPFRTLENCHSDFLPSSNTFSFSFSSYETSFKIKDYPANRELENFLSLITNQLDEFQSLSLDQLPFSSVNIWLESYDDAEVFSFPSEVMYDGSLEEESFSYWLNYDRIYDEIIESDQEITILQQEVLKLYAIKSFICQHIDCTNIPIVVGIKRGSAIPQNQTVIEVSFGE